MRAGLETKIIRRVLGALLLTGVLLVAGATAASADGYGPTYPVPSVPPQAPPGAPEPPPTLARTGSDSGVLVGAGIGAIAVGGGLVVLARQRKRRLAVIPT